MVLWQTVNTCRDFIIVYLSSVFFLLGWLFNVNDYLGVPFLSSGRAVHAVRRFDSAFATMLRTQAPVLNLIRELPDHSHP